MIIVVGVGWREREGGDREREREREKHHRLSFAHAPTEDQNCNLVWCTDNTLTS